MVRSPPFQGGNLGSNLSLGTINNKILCLYSITCLQKAKKPIEVKKCINVLIKVDGENKECGKSLESLFMETPITSCMMLLFYKIIS